MTRIVAVGLSHCNALRHAIEDGLFDDPDVDVETHVFVGRDDCWPFVDDEGDLHPTFARELDQILAEPADVVVLGFAGNAHTVLTLVEHETPIDIDDGCEAAAGRQLIPNAVVRDLFAASDRTALAAFDAIADRFRHIDFVVPLPPPPVAPELDFLIADPQFAPLHERGRAPLHVRRRAWELYCDILRETAGRIGARVLPPPPGAQRDDGALEPHLRRNETHATGEYGAMMIDQLRDLTATSALAEPEEPTDTTGPGTATRVPREHLTRAEIEELVLAFDDLTWHRQRHSIRVQPNFLGIGAGRCATTSLYTYLNSHPDVYLSPVKEPSYFGIRDDDSNEFGFDIDQYRSFFTAAQGEKIVGEISTAYLANARSCDAIREHLGTDVKLLATVRHPIDRCVSQYHSHFARHRWTDIDAYFDEGIEAYENASREAYEEDWYHPALSIVQSMYATPILRYAQAFGADSLHVIVFEDLMNETEENLRELCEFLEIDHREDGWGMSKLIPGNLQDKQRISSRVREKLHAIFAPEVSLLSDLTGVDFVSRWT